MEKKNRSSFPLIYSIDSVRLLHILISLYSTDDGLISRPKHVLQIEKYCRVSSSTIIDVYYSETLYNIGNCAS